MDSEPEQKPTARPRPKKRGIWIGIAGAVVLLVAYNATVTAPVATTLAKDGRNSGITLVGYRSFGVHPSEVTLDLWAVDGQTAPVDLLRSLFEAAEALKTRHFSRVVLAKSGKRVFVITGDDFQELGQSYSVSENPMYLIRTLPQKLYRTDGTPAYGTWEGGLLGVLSKQMQDVAAFATDWVSGTSPSATATLPAP